MSRYIDADALFAEFENVDWYNNADRDEIAERLVLQAPTIDAVEVVRGEWMEREVLEDTVINEWQSARCSVCNKYHTTPYMYYFDNFNFCPNCGSRMKGADDE